MAERRTTNDSFRGAAAASTAERLLVRGRHPEDEASQTVEQLAADITGGWRLIIRGSGSNMAGFSWSHAYQLGRSDDGRRWALSRVDFGDYDEPKEPPEVLILSVMIDPATKSETAIAQALLDASADWFKIDEVDETGDYEVDLPGGW